MTLFQAIGGLGLFLLGMIVMTESLRVVVGPAMRRALMQFTHTPFSGVLMGAATTAILQSSSATTVATVAFVNAGIISFSAALGIIFGANIGTTVTGWLVAILGFKLKLGTVVLPLIFIGASLKLLTQGRLAQTGYAIAGFGLIFVGITMMQDAMSGLQGIITPERLPSDTLLGRLQLVGFGIVATVITQSSSAGVAATLTMLYAGVVSFEQAAALVIGMDVGTTVTVVIATLGASLNARRTGLSHVFYNLFTATLALIFLAPYTWLVNRIAPGQLVQNAEIALVAFHTSFNLLGVSLILPFTGQFARLIQFIVPGQDAAHTDPLNEVLLKHPSLALNAVQSSIKSEFLALMGHLEAILDVYGSKRVNLADLDSNLSETHHYLDRIHLKTDNQSNWNQLIHLIHALDHLQRLHERCEEEEDRASTAKTTVELADEYYLLQVSIGNIIQDIKADQWIEAMQRADKMSKLIHKKVRPYRHTIMVQIANSQLDVLSGTARLEAIRWLRRVSKHISRITEHLNQAI